MKAETGRVRDMNMRKQVSRIGWAYAAFYLVSVASQLALAVLVFFGAPFLTGKLLNENVLTLVSQICMYGIGFPVFYLIMKTIPCWHMEEDRRIAGSDLFLLVVVCLGVTYIGNLLGQLLMLVSDTLLGSQSLNPVTDALNSMSLSVVFFSTVVIAPIMEELMFRKVLIDRIVPFGQKLVVVVSGVSFGLFHGNFYQFFYACSLGMIFAYLYSATGKLRYSIGLHMLINTIGGFLPLLLERLADGGSVLAMFALELLGRVIIFSILGTVAIVCLLRHRLSWFPSWTQEQGQQRAKSFLTAPGFWVFLLVGIVQFTMN